MNDNNIITKAELLGLWLNMGGVKISGVHGMRITQIVRLCIEHDLDLNEGLHFAGFYNWGK